MFSTEEKKEALQEKLKRIGQDGLLAFYEELNEAEKSALLCDIEAIDFPLMERLYQQATGKPSDASAAGRIEPISGKDAVSMPASERERLYRIGLNELAAGRMAALTMAGGQGTRLGHTGPKGTYDIGLPSHKSLFEIQCCGLKKISAEAGRPVPWYIMTSRINHDETTAFFAAHDYFGYGRENIYFFPQMMIPAMDREGRLLLENKYTVLKSPNGNGGLFASLLQSGGIEDMRRRGVTRIFICGIDNCLVKMADPLFLGFFEESGEKAAAKSFLKRTADEKAGVFCKRGGAPCVIEYTEIPKALAEQKDEQGTWVYGDTNVLNYIFELDTAERLADAGLPYHIAVKKLNYIDFRTGTPAILPDGYKFELFLFDAFSRLDGLAVLRIERTEEFAPVKNLTGIDSAETAREMYLNIHKEELLQ